MKPVDDMDLDLESLVDEAPHGGTRETMHEDSALPLRHFSLTAHPFADSVNPNFFFRTEAHEEAFIAMKQCIEDNVSLGLTTALSGTGKTLLTQVLLQELDKERFQSILVLAYPGMTKTGLLREILTELGAEDIPERVGAHKLITTIQQHIINQYLAGVRLILIIDEVHFLKAEALHILRTLSNIEVPEQKLVTVLLFGERMFLKKMKHPNFRSIFSRTFVRTELRPLHRSEVEQYIKFRLLVAGGRPGIFDASSLDPLFERSLGIPREVNRICHNALSLAAKQGKPAVDAAIMNVIPAAQAIDLED
jgi:general secretion pathway protein A